MSISPKSSERILGKIDSFLEYLFERGEKLFKSVTSEDVDRVHIIMNRLKLLLENIKRLG